MADKDDLFEEQSEAGADTGSGDPSGTDALAGTGDQAGQILDKWVGEGKKFSSVEQLVESYDNSQAFIEQLKQENADMRRELTNAEKLDQILSRIEASGSQGAGSPNGEGPSRETPSGGTGQGEANSDNIEERISEAVRNEVTRLERQRTADQNQQEASNQLLELAGNDREEAKRLLKKSASDLGVSVSYLQHQAQTSPSAFKRLVSASASAGPGQSGGSAASGGSHNSEAFETNSFRHPDSEVKPWSHWKKARREMSSSEFYSPAVQNRIFKSRQELGDAFFDTQ